MRRTILFRDLMELISGDAVRTQLSERMAIERQANLMRVAARIAHEGREASAATAARIATAGRQNGAADGGIRFESTMCDDLYDGNNNATWGATAAKTAPIMDAASVAEANEARALRYEADHAAAAARTKMRHLTSLNPPSESAALFMPAPIDFDALDDRHRCVPAPNWPTMPAGWVMFPDTAVAGYDNTNSNTTCDASSSPPLASSSSSSCEASAPAEGSAAHQQQQQQPMVVQKVYCFLDQPNTYKFLGMVGAAVSELGFPPAAAEADASPSSSSAAANSPPQHPFATPRIEWMWSEVTVTMLSTPQTHRLAHYLNDLEVRLGQQRNASRAALEHSQVAWSAHLQQKVEEKASRGFLWIFNSEKGSMANFVQSLYVQWCNRSEYLVTRKSRERKEFRPNLTLSGAIAEGAERRRRAERRKFKDKISEAAPHLVGMDADDFSRYSFDTLPRETRERMDADRSRVGGMEEGRMRIGGPQAFARPSSMGM